jgi:protein translocase SecG subunit
MISFLTGLQLFSSFLIVALVLLQPAKQGASAFANTQTGPMGNAAGSTPLFKMTMFLAAFLMLSSLIISRTRIVDAKSSAVDDLTATSVAKPTESEPVTDLTKPAPLDPKAQSTANPKEGAPTAKPEAAPAQPSAPQAPSAQPAPAPKK